MNRAPSYYSLAFNDMPAPDFADMTIGVLPEGTTHDPAEWARAIFAINAMPLWVRVALVLRQVLAPLIGVPPAPRTVFAVTSVEGDEALIAFDDKHLDFRCAVGVDATNRLVRVTTTVMLKGVRGFLYFAPVRIAHPVVLQSILARASKNFAREALTV